MNFKSLAISALLAISSIGGAAQAAPTTCFVQHAGESAEIHCDLHTRTNANGHTVNDIALFHGDESFRMSVIYWMDDYGNPTYAEVFADGQRAANRWYVANNGAYCMERDATLICVN